jgi:hypothetical protein
MTDVLWYVRDVIELVRDGMAPELLAALGLFLLVAMSGHYITKRQTR